MIETISNNKNIEKPNNVKVNNNKENQQPKHKRY